MNDIYARRAAQSGMLQNLYRTHATLWQATRVTKEKLDYAFVKEEFMRVNGHRTMPLLVAASAQSKMQNCHFNQLTDACAWADSARAFSVRNQTPLTKHIAAMGRMEITLPQMKLQTTAQSLFSEYNAICDGVASFDEEPQEVQK